MPTSTRSAGTLIFTVANYCFLGIAAALCLFPVLHIVAVSLSSAGPAAANEVVLWPIEFTMSSYSVLVSKASFLTSFGISVERTVLGVALNTTLTLLMGYPLSKTSKELPGRNVYMWMLVFVMLFNAGLVPNYLLIKTLGLIDSIWALVLPSAVPIFNIILVMNFMKMLPREIEEAAYVDGASYWVSWWKLILPLSKPVIATIVLFSFVMHWNSWYDGLIYMNDNKNYPLQTFLYTVIQEQDITSIEQANEATSVNGVTLKAAQIFIAMVPILFLYPFLQKYFTKGIVIGAVKG
ncbi:putative aldouronate transport system permease protein [Paenibacillus phyllosphaerae]|uniref:Putative aldouronate transport system permease protein n=1 Tax=Paenibacillus phyllosphaerae TaxID=274593 RepID=A0A7W5AZS9_9BACL|nr:carbohydrate ABC transporter permease [Paenibacillus phyllosphaerae]MBB3111758.1 putative aldouronate transport system permease protein [Paenibacillus phyllosphaerae]